MNTRIMYDSVDINVIPTATDLAAVYSTGRWATTDAEFIARFGSVAKRVYIDAIGSDPANSDVLDVENGDATPAQARPWIQQRLKLGKRATIYCNRSTIPAVWSSCSGLSYNLWIATLDGTTTWNGKQLSEVAGVIGVQQYGALQLGFNCDKSVIYDSVWPHKPASPPPPPPHTRSIIGVVIHYSDGTEQTIGK